MFEDCPASELIKVFKTGRSHMALVKRVVESEDSDPYYSTVGIITLEDLIEEILGEEIEDEMDAAALPSQRISTRGATGGGELPREHPLLAYLADKNRMECTLPQSEVDAIVMFLSGKHKQTFGEHRMSSENLHSLVKLSTVLRLSRDDGERVLYSPGATTSTFTLVLDGHILVRAGQDGFESTCGPVS